MRRLVIFQPFGDRRGGSDNILLTTLEHRDPDLFDPLVVTFGEGDFNAAVKELGVPTVALPTGRMRDPVHLRASIRRCRALLRTERPDLILNWLSTAHVYAGPAAALEGMTGRCVWWQLDLFAERAPEGARLRDRLATGRGNVLDRVSTAIPARAIGCCSDSVLRAQARIRPRRELVSVLPGIDPPQAAGDDEVEALRAELGVPSGATVVGIVGRLFGWKGHHLLMEAFAGLRERDRGLHCLIVGGGGHRPDERYEAFLREEVRRLGIESEITFTGQVPDATPYIQMMDVFVNASSPEPFGLVVLEAMALGVPAVAVATGGPAEIITDGVDGVLAPDSSPSSLAAGIGSLLDDPERRRRIAARGLERYRERFTGERMAREMEASLARFAA